MLFHQRVAGRARTAGLTADLLARAPLAGRYPADVALALLALCPFIILTTAFALFQGDVRAELGASAFGVQLADGLSNAAYAFGAVAAADLIQRVSGRRLYLACETLFVVGSMLGVFAPTLVVFTLARVLQGLATGMLLVAALPPLVTNHGADKVPTTAAFVNLGLFGMVTLGPVAGGLTGDYNAWRLLFAAVAGLGAAGLVIGALTFRGNEPPARGMSFDWLAIPLAAGGTVLPFLGVAWLSRGSFLSAGVLVPLVVGLLALGVLIVGQYRKKNALMPVRPISNTLPVTGISTAMAAGAAFTTLLALTEVYLFGATSHPPAIVGALLASQVVGVAVAAWLFKRILPTRWLPVLALGGLGSVAVGGVLLLALSPGAETVIVPLAGLLLGFGAGAGVAPGLFMGGFSVPATRLGPTFALVELLRSEAAFLVGPVLVYVATIGGSLTGGLHLAVGITVAFAAVSGLALLVLLLLGGVRPHAPDLEGWLTGRTTAYHSPRVAALLRDRD